MDQRPLFVEAWQAFSKSLSEMPQDDLPKDIFEKATKILDGMRADRGNPLFGIEKGKQILPNQSNLSLGFVYVWEDEWGKKNIEKRLFIDIYKGPDEEMPEQTPDWIMDYEIEREHYVAVRMATFLRDQAQDIPDSLRDYLGLPRSGSGEVK